METNHGKRIKEFWWPEDEMETGRCMKSCPSMQIELANEFHGDHDEDWIVVKNPTTGREISRHNPRYMESIIWEEEPTD